MVYEDEFFGGGTSTEEITESEKLAKQFLTFSDNRQSAAFFASYLETTYKESLIKRIMTLAAQNNQKIMADGITLDRYADEVERLLNEYEIFQKQDRRKQAWLAILKDMVNFKARNSLQNKGILFYDFDLTMPANTKLGLSASETTDMFKIFLKHYAHCPMIITYFIHSF